MKRILVDSGILFAVFDPADSHAYQAESKAHYLDSTSYEIVLLWPILYETLNTRFARKPKNLRRFEAYLKQPYIRYLDDDGYRDEALRLTMQSSLINARPLSLVDCVIRLVLDDSDVRIDYLLTFNIRDFDDVCRRRGIQII